MSLPTAADPARLPTHVLFPEQYEASKRMIVRDFIAFGALIVGGVVLSVTLANVVAG